MTSSMAAPIILNRVLCNPKMNRQVPGAGGGPCTLLPKNPLLQQNTGLAPDVVQSNLTHSLTQFPLSDDLNTSHPPGLFMLLYPLGGVNNSHSEMVKCYRRVVQYHRQGTPDFQVVFLGPV